MMKPSQRKIFDWVLFLSCYNKMRLRRHQVPSLFYCNNKLRCLCSASAHGGHQNFVLMNLCYNVFKTRCVLKTLLCRFTSFRKKFA